jgi:altronate dehydratase
MTTSEKTAGHGHAHTMHYINTCAQLKSLVDALNNTGQVHVFSTSKGHWRRGWAPQPWVLFRTNTSFARKLKSVIDSCDASKLLNQSGWSLSARFCAQRTFVFTTRATKQPGV